jgi:hypothetical protein
MQMAEEDRKVVIAAACTLTQLACSASVDVEAEL